MSPDKVYLYQPFVILGTARTGSTLLWSYLNSHPEILCMRGIFGSTGKINFGKYYGVLPEECDDPVIIEERNNNPVNFIKNHVFMHYDKPYKAVGFKYFYDHDRHLKDKNELTEYFDLNKDIKFIHLRRENLLAALYSYKRALAQRRWMSAEPGFTIKIPIEECDQYFHTVSARQNYFDSLLLGRDILIGYEELINEPYTVLKSIQTFLGVNPLKLRTETIKNHEIPLTDAILNYSELREYFKNSKWKDYFNE